VTRREIVAPEDLEAAIRCVVEDYGAFVARRPPPGAHDDPKAFAAHHAAAKSALAHLEHLLKLTRAAGAGEEEHGVAAAALLLRQARGDMAAVPENEEDCGTDDEGPPG
jgi:acetylornithine deacetylase/succinyl-diaminopimelate desuccinylase-like protein